MRGPGVRGAIGPAVVIGEPLEVHLDILTLNHNTLNQTAVEVVLVVVLDLHVPADELG